MAGTPSSETFDVPTTFYVLLLATSPLFISF